MWPGALYLSRHGGNIGQFHSPPVDGWPFGTGGHGDPNRGTLPDETGHQYVTVDSLFCFPYFPLVTLYLFLFDFPLPLPFSFRVL